MALFKGKTKEFTLEDLNSPVLNKLIEFNSKKGRLAADLNENEEKISVLTAQVEKLREKYADSLTNEDLKSYVAADGELSALKSVVKAQKDILDKGNKREYVLSKEEQESLMKTFAPIRKKQDDITKKLTSLLVEVEKTLNELEEEQKAVHQVWGKFWGPVITASQENWLIGNNLNRQREASVAQNKLGQLQGHEALNIHHWHR